MEDEKQGGATTISILLNVKGKESHATLLANVKARHGFLCSDPAALAAETFSAASVRWRAA
eukprot:1382897-Rhodomonas_salina.1